MGFKSGEHPNGTEGRKHIVGVESGSLLGLEFGSRTEPRFLPRFVMQRTNISA